MSSMYVHALFSNSSPNDLIEMTTPHNGSLSKKIGSLSPKPTSLHVYGPGLTQKGHKRVNELFLI